MRACAAGGRHAPHQSPEGSNGGQEGKSPIPGGVPTPCTSQVWWGICPESGTGTPTPVVPVRPRAVVLPRVVSTRSGPPAGPRPHVPRARCTLGEAPPSPEPPGSGDGATYATSAQEAWPVPALRTRGHGRSTEGPGGLAGVLPHAGGRREGGTGSVPGPTHKGPPRGRAT